MADEQELRGQAKRGAERRAAIIQAAIEVFAEKGFRDGSLTDVADKVGVSPAGILYHFNSKEELLLAVIAERDRRTLQTPRGELKGLEALRAMVRFAEQSEGEKGLAALHTVLQVESFDPEAITHNYFLIRSRLVRASAAVLLQEAQEMGEVRADIDPVAKANEIVAFLEGAAITWLMDPELSLVTLYENYFDDLCRAIAAEPQGD